MRANSPSSVRSRIPKAVAYDSWPIDDMHDLGNPAMARRTVSDTIEFVAGGLRDGLHNPERRTNEYREGIVAPYYQRTGEDRLSARRQRPKHQSYNEARSPAKNINTPTRLIWGVHDPWETSPQAEYRCVCIFRLEVNTDSG